MTGDERLLQFPKDGASWERKPTDIPYAVTLKLPRLKASPESLAIEINPVAYAGSVTKKRGLAIRFGSELN